MANALESEIRKLALINAAQFEGKANAAAVFGRAMGTISEAKADPKKTRELVGKIVLEINKLAPEKQAEEMARLKVEVPKVEKEKPRTELPPLKGAVEGQVVTRFAPEPNGYMHFGHLKAAVMSNFYAKMYKGKAILRFDDTNPRKEKKEFYEAIKADLDSLGFKWDVLTKTSEHMEDIYRYAEDLILKGIFYICTCPQEELEKQREEGRECPHRAQNENDNLILWKKMQAGMKEGEACVRIKIDMKSKNPVLRDPTMLRIVEFPHAFYDTKYHVYPLYNFSTVVCDHKFGITHVFRDKGFENDAMIQEIIYGHLGWKAPEAHQFGRLKTMAGIPLSKRKQKELIERGELTGFDDLRIPTPRNFIKRGFLPESLIQVMIEIGPSKADIDVSEEMLESINRKLIDEQAARYFFVANPVLMVIEGAKETVAHPPLYPTHPERGARELKCTGKVFVSASDLELIKKSKEVRLKDLYNAEVQNAGEKISARFAGNELKKTQASQAAGSRFRLDIPIIHWVPFEKNVKLSLVMPNGSHVHGLAEEGVKEGIVQFERVGFARVTKENGSLIAYFAHG